MIRNSLRLLPFFMFASCIIGEVEEPEVNHINQAGLTKPEIQHNGWNEYLDSRNGRGITPGEDYNIKERFVDRHSGRTTEYEYTGRDKNGDGRLTQDEFDFVRSLDRNPGTGSRSQYDSEDGSWDELDSNLKNRYLRGQDVKEDVIELEEYLGFFPHNTPNPFIAPKSITLRSGQTAKERSDYIKIWINSNLADRWSKYGFRHIKGIRFVKSSSPSIFNTKNNYVYISSADRSEYGPVVLDHELTIAGLYWAHRNKKISSLEFARMKNLNVSKFRKFNGYVGTARGNFNKYGALAGKAFTVGVQYAKIKKKLARGKINGVKFNARKYKRLVDSNAIVTRDTSNRAIRMVTGGGSKPAAVKEFLDPFVLDRPLSRKIKKLHDNMPSISTSSLRALVSARAK